MSGSGSPAESGGPIERVIREKVGRQAVCPTTDRMDILRLDKDHGFSKLTLGMGQINNKFVPTRLEIYNDSHLHRHHKAMAGSTSAETHFRLVITSGEFRDKTQIKRHRLVNELLKEDLAREGGIHALQLRTMTPEEDEKRSSEN